MEKDLNKMEFKVKQISDTRERIGLKHIKSLYIVEKEIDRIMPNSLTQSQVQRNLLLNKEVQMSSLEIIRQDIENVDDIFSMGFFGNVNGGAQENEDQNEGDERKESQWVISSGNEDLSHRSRDESDSGSSSEIIKKMESDKQQILS